MHHYLGFGSRSTSTPQSEPIPGTNQQLNNTGVGYSFVVDDMTRLYRFLCLGTSGGTFYVGERKLTKESLDAVECLLKAGRGHEVVAKIIEISDAGRGVSNDPALFALARCCAADDKSVSRAAYDALPRVARTGTHLLHFMAYVKQFRGRGRQHRRAIKAWYNEKSVEQLAYQVIKYQQRDGWSQRDVLRLAHPKPIEHDREQIYRWIVKGWQDILIPGPGINIIAAVEQIHSTANEREVASLIKQYRLPREAIPTEHLKSVAVWEALLEAMPLEAMTRNLATMTRNGVLEAKGSFTHSVAERLMRREAIQKARLHPVKLLAALTTYQSGKSVRGSGEWTPIQEIIDALECAFYLSFDYVEPTDKRVLIAIDVSGSMHGTNVNGIPNLQCHTAAAAMAMVTAASCWRESAGGVRVPGYSVMAFADSAHPLSILPTMRLNEVTRIIESAGSGGTDCAIPMQRALQQKMVVDAFVVLSDNETWQGSAHPTQRLQEYRKQMNPQARIVNVQMTSTHVTNNAPDDGLALECCGFSTDTPQVINAFVRGEI